MTEFIITCQSELQKDGSYNIERYRELVRCKDCKHYHKGFNCDLLQKPIMKGDDWFCADGRKRDDT